MTQKTLDTSNGSLARAQPNPPWVGLGAGSGPEGSLLEHVQSQQCGPSAGREQKDQDPMDHMVLAAELRRGTGF